jgi:ribosomal protein S18 acetylase RimI-like enzyme
VNSVSSAINVRLVSPADSARLGDLFESLGGDPAAAFFRPHPLTRAQAEQVVSKLASGQDLYFVASDGTRFLGYGMLRGWDEGYSVPSIGVAVAPGSRGCGVGRTLLRWAIRAARERGSTRVMLKVHPENAGARQLYESEGFVFDEPSDDGTHVKGVLHL